MLSYSGEDIQNQLAMLNQYGNVTFFNYSVSNLTGFLSGTISDASPPTTVSTAYGTGHTIFLTLNDLLSLNISRATEPPITLALFIMETIFGAQVSLCQLIRSDSQQLFLFLLLYMNTTALIALCLFKLFYVQS